MRCFLGFSFYSVIYGALLKQIVPLSLQRMWDDNIDVTMCLKRSKWLSEGLARGVMCRYARAEGKG